MDDKDKVYHSLICFVLYKLCIWFLTYKKYKRYYIRFYIKTGDSYEVIKKIGILSISSMLLVNSLQASSLKCLNENNTTMVSLRLISEELGAQVKFEQTDQTIILSYKNIVVMLKVGSKKVIVNGQEKELQVMPQVITGVT